MNQKNKESRKICTSLRSFIKQNEKCDRECLKAQWNSNKRITKARQSINRRETSVRNKKISELLCTIVSREY